MVHVQEQRLLSVIHLELDRATLLIRDVVEIVDSPTPVFQLFASGFYLIFIKYGDTMLSQSLRPICLGEGIGFLRPWQYHQE